MRVVGVSSEGGHAAGNASQLYCRDLTTVAALAARRRQRQRRFATPQAAQSALLPLRRSRCGNRMARPACAGALVILGECGANARVAGGGDVVAALCWCCVRLSVPLGINYSCNYRQELPRRETSTLQGSVAHADAMRSHRMCAACASLQASFCVRPCLLNSSINLTVREGLGPLWCHTCST